MTKAAWRYVYTSVRGTGHLENGLPCQDDSVIREFTNDQDERVLVMVASDGAGSAAESDKGSQLVCEETVKLLELRFCSAGERPNESLGLELAQKLKGLLTNQAETLGCSLRDLACTLNVAVIHPTWAWFMQIGDGAIIVQREASLSPTPFEVVFWPDNGPYANQTYFLTDVPDHHVHAQLMDGSVERISLITDGLQLLALVLAERRAHPPFFLPMFQTVEAATGEGSEAHQALEPALTQFLESQAINDRTNDDKTLVLASRVQPTMPAVPVLLEAEDDGLLVIGELQEVSAEVVLPETEAVLPYDVADGPGPA